jgi:predicted cupin superfamily sugar epimerase
LRYNKSIDNSISAPEVIQIFGLEALPVEGGFFKVTYRDHALSSIYYLITEDSFSSLHSLRSSEIWNFYAGDPAQMVQISPEGILHNFTLGTDIRAGHSYQIRVPPHYLQGTRLLGKGSWALFGCTVSPPFEEAHFSHVQRSEIIKKFPHLFDTICRYTRS